MTEETTTRTRYTRPFSELRSEDVPLVGGKNASLGEMVRELSAEGVRVPDGFATTADAYRAFIEHNDLEPRLRELLDARERGDRSLAEAGGAIREAIRGGEMPEELADAIRDGYRRLSEEAGREELDVAVRSSATAEDLPEASFAGQLESYLNVCGEEELLETCRRCFASLFTDRAISYREEQGFDHMEIALSVGVQRMVRADRAGSGVLFTLDTDTGFPDVVLINAAWGLGENVVQGTVNPDQYSVFTPFLDRDGVVPIIEKTRGDKEKKMVYADGEEGPTRNVETTEEERLAHVLDDDEIQRLARWGDAIERHYGRPMDVEWAKDGETGELFVVQARPETVQSRREARTLRTYHLEERGERLCTGLSIGDAVATGPVQVIESARNIERFEEGSVLVTDRTDPDWVPIMKKAAAIVTDRGGRTSHAAIVSRELGVPAVIGTGDATRALEDGRGVTVSCAEGHEGYVYDGILEFRVDEVDLDDLPSTDTGIMLNIASPAGAMRWWKLPVDGVGLARMEYLINNVIKVHPMALVRFEELEGDVRERVEELTLGYVDRTEYFVDHLARGIATIAASRYPDPVIVRTSDFKTNEYADLLGGEGFEPREENPMLGWRGASRYHTEGYREGFALECRALRRVRREMGFDNVIVMIPFCRTVEEADRVLGAMAEHGLGRGEDGLRVYVMAEIPSNVLQADEFAERFDGFSIGSNDLTQLVLGVDRDAATLADLFDERNPSVKKMIRTLIRGAHDAGRTVGICGQAPSDHPDFAEFLVRAGVDSISLSPDSVVEVTRRVAGVESEMEASLQPTPGLP
ncbi:MAG: phosphoenolpyruvate synthase [Candidatus Palauibacterales bacterium]|nr:phosphoenolpyruvate synthase [Candidatus Palauibacterales bacterium]